MRFLCIIWEPLGETSFFSEALATKIEVKRRQMLNINLRLVWMSRILRESGMRF